MRHSDQSCGAITDRPCAMSSESVLETYSNTRKITQLMLLLLLRTSKFSLKTGCSNNDDPKSDEKAELKEGIESLTGQISTPSSIG